MNLIFTMAGNYSRFKEAGFKIPKYLLPWESSNILNHTIGLMRSGFDNIFLIANKKDNQYFDHIKMILKVYDIPFDNLIIIDDTQSQNESAYKGISSIKEKLDGPLFIHNVDTLLYKRDFIAIKKLILNCSGYIDIFKSNNHNYSYVISENQIINNVAEKILISDNASSGLYGFKNLDTYLKYYKKGFIIDMFKDLIEDNHSILHGNIHSEKDTIVLGTPSEYFHQSKLILNY